MPFLCRGAYPLWFALPDIPPTVNISGGTKQHDSHVDPGYQMLLHWNLIRHLLTVSHYSYGTMQQMQSKNLVWTIQMLLFYQDHQATCRGPYKGQSIQYNQLYSLYVQVKWMVNGQGGWGGWECEDAPFLPGWRCLQPHSSWQIHPIHPVGLQTLVRLYRTLINLTFVSWGRPSILYPWTDFFSEQLNSLDKSVFGPERCFDNY